MSEQRIQDIATLAQCSLLSALPMDEIGFLLEELTPVSLKKGSVIESSPGAEPALHFVLEGEIEIEDRNHRRKLLKPGDVFGETALVGRAGPERAIALSELRLARLPAGAYAALAKAQPRAAFHLAEGALRIVAERLHSAESRASGQRAASSPAQTTLMAGSAVRGNEHVGGVPIADRLPRELEGALVVAGREGERLLALHTLSTAAAVVIPVTTRDWEGRDIYRRSAGIVLLEAARQLRIRLQLGPSITSGRLAFPAPTVDRAALARALDERLLELRRAAIPIQEELWSVPDAIDLFQKQDDPSARLLLEDALDPVVTLLRCGETWAAAPRPLLPHAGLLEDVHVIEHPLGLLLDFGTRIRAELPRRPTPTIALELRAPRYGAPMTLSEAQWLRLFGVESVGTFNRVCVQGKVPELIRVSEGFHEKRIAEIADHVKQRDGVRIVAVAGPSSSGKTTFIKRLLVQLRVNGIEPVELSLDDYYMDRGQQARDANGEVDFEALEALNLARLRADLELLLRGSAVRPPRYDFRQGLSRAEAGAELLLTDRSVLLIEGIHALNPALYGRAGRSSAFNVFIHPATSLAFDRLSSLEPADVRLLRRIVRDRHQRGFAAEETLSRWPSVRRAERLHIVPFQGEADAVFDSSLIYEVSVLRVYAERYLLEVPRSSSVAPSARRLRQLLQLFVPIHPDHVPPTSILREFIGGSGFSY
jgi:uridine kinase